MAVIEGITAMEGYKNKSSLYIKLINNSNVPFYYNIKTTIVNKIKNSIVIPNGVNTKSNTFKYELQASLIYDLINNTNTFLFELKSKPVIKN